MGCIKNSANIITSLRIVFAGMMLVAEPFSTRFWVCYLCGGLSDLIDGLVARTLGQQTSAGAKLDSIADIIFAFAILIVAANHLILPSWLWLCAAIIAFLRMMSYAIGFYKYHTFSALHTVWNKVTGALIFAFPLLYALWGISISGGILCIVAFISSIEELFITVRSKELNRD